MKQQPPHDPGATSGGDHPDVESSDPGKLVGEEGGNEVASTAEFTSDDCAIKTQRLTKIYNEGSGTESLCAVYALDLSIPKGEVYGLIGPNGAGKSSLMRIIATLLTPSFGTVSVHGFDSWTDREELCRILGYMPELFHLYEELTVEEYLDFFAGAYGVPRARRKKTIDDVIELTDLGVRQGSPTGNLSKGMKQRLLLAKTLLHDPEVLLLDEPTSGMDPQARIEFRNIVKVLAQMKKTIVISSHILSDLSSLCTSFGIMEQGVMRVDGSFEDVANELAIPDRVEIDYFGPAQSVSRVLEELELGSTPEFGDGTVSFDFQNDDQALSELLKKLVDGGVPLTRFVRRKCDLEEIFLQIGADQVQ